MGERGGKGSEGEDSSALAGGGASTAAAVLEEEDEGEVTKPKEHDLRIPLLGGLVAKDEGQHRLVRPGRRIFSPFPSPPAPSGMNPMSSSSSFLCLPLNSGILGSEQLLLLANDILSLSLSGEGERTEWEGVRSG